ncbi:MAG TPA: hypothetical protein VGX68_15435 [Thermoanaerobaculia bacterium]|jgi:hypothetical protein|nr:hypothetical protein [Thermoanaerobaculia bacterium]
MAFISRDLTQKLFACGQCTLTPEPDCTPTPPDCTPTPPDCTPTPPDCTPTPPDNCTPTPGDEGKHRRQALGELRQQLREALAQNP